MAVTMMTPNSQGQIRFFTWTHTEGESAESFTVLGPVLGSLAWIDETYGQPVIVKCTTSLNTSTAVNTITIQCTGTVTSGKGFIVSAMR